MGKLEETLAGLQEQVDGLKRRLSEVDGAGLPLDRLSDPLNPAPPGRLSRLERFEAQTRNEVKDLLDGLGARMTALEQKTACDVVLTLPEEVAERFCRKVAEGVSSAVVEGAGVPGAKTATEVMMEYRNAEEMYDRHRTIQRLLVAAESWDREGHPNNAVTLILKILREWFPKRATIDDEEGAPQAAPSAKTAAEVCGMTPHQFDAWLDLLMRHGYAKARARVLSGEGAPVVPAKPPAVPFRSPEFYRLLAKMSAAELWKKRGDYSLHDLLSWAREQRIPGKVKIDRELLIDVLEELLVRRGAL